MSKTIVCTPQVRSEICAYIRAGGFPTVAAEAAGIPKSTFLDWMKRGENPHAKQYFRDFFKAVIQAKAQARMNAEMEVFKGHPIAWLKSGPGKETKESPGWTSTIKPQITQDNRSVNVMLQPEMMGMFASILQILLPFPEARAAVAMALAGSQQPKQIAVNADPANESS